MSKSQRKIRSKKIEKIEKEKNKKAWKATKEFIESRIEIKDVFQNLE